MGHSRIHLVALLVVLAFIPGHQQPRAESPAILRSESNRPYIHRITLYDSQGKAISPSRGESRPFSMEQTCGKCHDVASIQAGWHFNHQQQDVDNGRPGEPWILTDVDTGTQLPLSYRGWKGTWNPAGIGLSQEDFVRQFGSHHPGQSLPAQSADDAANAWPEIDCMACHGLDPGYDPAARASQIEKGNIEYLSIAALGVGIVRGSAADQAAKTTTNADPFAEFDPAAESTPKATALKIDWDTTRFDADDRVFFDLSRKGKTENCMACHTVHVSDPLAGTASWHRDGDVHLVSGLSCTDCHRNGIDHQIVRGHPQSEATSSVYAFSLSCQGCHLGDGEGSAGGRLGSPIPEHRGLPPVHFEVMSCTVCHSGPLPSQDLHLVQTSMGHRLGIAEFRIAGDRMPIIQEPVYLRGEDGRITPHRLLWPAFWGIRQQDGTVKPLLPMDVRQLAGELIQPGPKEEPRTQVMTPESVTSILKHMNDNNPSRQHVYISNGLLHSLDQAGALQSDRHDAAEPYAWPLGHDVRPAAQSLGARACQDCHSPESAFFFADRNAAGPLAGAPMRRVSAAALMGVDEEYHRLFANSFRFRTTYKVIGGTALGILLLILVYALSRTLWLISVRFKEDRP